LSRRRFLALALGIAVSPARADVAYPDVKPGTTLAFPRDEGAHPAFRSEWWYVTGWLRDPQGRECGFQITFFRNRPGVAEASTSRFAPKQLLFAHAAIADPTVQRLRIDQRAAREGFGLAYAATGHTDVRIDDWSLVQDADRFAAKIAARDFALDLSLTATMAPLLQGDRGVSRKGPDPVDASYYYSRPQLAVTGTLALEHVGRAVTGVAWLDHEWSSRYLPKGAVGWDWTGINFDDGAALMAFRMRDGAGKALWAGGTWRDPNGATTTLAPTDIDFTPLRHWRSPRTGVHYPVGFRVRAGDVVVALEPLFADQELDARIGVGTV
jgi:predicted secreted hydrolase